MVYLPQGDVPVNVLGAFLSLSHDRNLSRDNRDALYRWADVWIDRFPGADELLLRSLEIDHDVDPVLVMEIVNAVVARDIDNRTRDAVIRCVIAHLRPGLDSRAQVDLVRAIGPTLDEQEWTELHLNAAIRLAELKIVRFSITREHADRLLETYADRRPDFVSRIGILVKNA
jgi:hypothetical protein